MCNGTRSVLPSLVSAIMLRHMPSPGHGHRPLSRRRDHTDSFQFKFTLYPAKILVKHSSTIQVCGWFLKFPTKSQWYRHRLFNMICTCETSEGYPHMYTCTHQPPYAAPYSAGSWHNSLTPPYSIHTEKLECLRYQYRLACTRFGPSVW